MNNFVALCCLHARTECEIRNGKFSVLPVTSSQITDNTFTYFHTGGQAIVSPVFPSQH